MPSRYQNKQKSPKRRFLFILGTIAFIGYLAFGLIVIFWDKILPEYGYKKTLFGSLVIIYGIFRFVRLFRKEEEADEE